MRSLKSTSLLLLSLPLIFHFIITAVLVWLLDDAWQCLNREISAKRSATSFQRLTNATIEDYVCTDLERKYPQMSLALLSRNAQIKPQEEIKEFLRLSPDGKAAKEIMENLKKITIDLQEFSHSPMINPQDSHDRNTVKSYANSLNDTVGQIEVLNKRTFGIVQTTADKSIATIAAIKNFILISALLLTIMAICLILLVVQSIARPAQIMIDNAMRLLERKPLQIVAASPFQEIQDLVSGMESLDAQIDKAFELEKTVFDYSLALIVEISEDGGFIKANQTAREWLGLPMRDQDEDLSLYSLAGLRDRSIAEAVASNANKVASFKTMSGGRTLSWSVTPVAQDANRYICVAIDDSENQRLDTLRKQMTDYLSTEIGGPLTRLRLNLGRIKLEQNARIANDMRMMDNNLSRISLLLEDLITLPFDAANTQADKKERPKSAGVREALRAAKEALAPAAAQKDVALIEHITEPSLASVSSVSIDQFQLERVLINLVSNAVKYSPPGTKVTLSAKRDGSTVTFTVEDEGPGIPADQAALIFEPYKQIDDGQKAVPSTGLGLTVAKKIIESRGGRIGVKSAASGGACFWFQLDVSGHKL
ncbi:MAG: sensor histidine kinase [Candidatus Obscuribacterales bacterium]|nr:sensor histidine kinase [Candidatus Obscuribacterales bacterium]